MIQSALRCTGSVAACASVAASLLATGCEGPPLEPLEGPAPIASVSDGSITAELLVRGAPRLLVGRNTIGVRLRDEVGATTITEATLAQSWVMAMNDGSHSCPDKDPVGPADQDVIFPATVVLPMASGPDGSWVCTLTVQPPGGEQHTFTLSDLPVSGSDRAKALLGSDGATYLITLSFGEVDGATTDPVVGANAFILTVHEQQGEAEYLPVEDLALTVTADMPSMGHGSSSLSYPGYQDQGEYAGNLELAMPGPWELSVTVARGASTLGVVLFDVLL